MPKKKNQTTAEAPLTLSENIQEAEESLAPAEKLEVFHGVWYVMKRNWGGWELYKRTPEVVARCFEHTEYPGRVRYEVFGSDTAGGPLICDANSFRDNAVRVATEEDAKLGPREPLA